MAVADGVSSARWRVGAVAVVIMLCGAALAACSNSSDNVSADSDTAASLVPVASGSVGAGITGGVADDVAAGSELVVDEVAVSPATTVTSVPTTTRAPLAPKPVPTTETTEDVTTVLPSGYTMGVTTLPGASGMVTVTVPLPTEKPRTLAQELVVNVSIDPKLDTDGIDIDGAIQAYKDLRKVVDLALASPDPKWKPKILDLATGDAANILISEIETLFENDVYVAGHSSFVAVVTAASNSDIVLNVCVDGRATDIRQKGREGSIRASEGSRSLQRAVVTLLDGKKWYVSETGTQVADRC